eukprot:TRINITY_DN5110_c0_g2_i3.p1 TRINITY_DN5110_c0_g2~~TRINITY_DN5110_c0_g2_i3.p1  ORF type:complete len:439 (-),score=161.76 TRINITY_DN5110_c0_g2_i3:1242-2558(-)
MEERKKLEPAVQAQLPPLPFSDSDEKDRETREAITAVAQNITKALEEGGEGDGLVSREIRGFREKQAKLEKEKREREKEMERKRRLREEEENRNNQRKKEREEREYRDREQEWLEYERRRSERRRREEDKLRERQIMRKQALLYDDEDDKPRRRKIQSREARRLRLKERDQDRHDTMKDLHEEEMKRKEQEKRLQELEQQKLLVLQREREHEEWKRREQESSVEENKGQERIGGTGLSGGGPIGTMVTTTPKRMGQEPSGIKIESGVASPQTIVTSAFSFSLGQLSLKAVPKAVKTPVVAPGFNAEPVEEEYIPNKKRKLVTLDNKPLHTTYVKEEIQTPEKQIPEKQTPENQTPEKQIYEKQTLDKQVLEKQTPEKQVEKQPEKQAEKQAEKQVEKKLDPSTLMASIPSDRAALFGYTINWDVIDKLLVWIMNMFLF